MLLTLLLTGCAKEQASKDAPWKQNALYYPIEDARRLLENEGYRIGADVEVVSNNRAFRYTARMVPEKHQYCTINRTGEVEARYNEAAKAWDVEFWVTEDYDWHFTGSYHGEVGEPGNKRYLQLNLLSFEKASADQRGGRHPEVHRHIQMGRH